MDKKYYNKIITYKSDNDIFIKTHNLIINVDTVIDSILIVIDSIWDNNNDE